MSTQSSPRVLIVDDEPHVRELLREFLTGLGYDVATAATGLDALDAVPDFRPDVIVLDMLMPLLSGKDVLGALRRTGSTAPVILISGNDDSTNEGFFAVLTKPFDLGGMAGVVAAAVHHGHRGDA